MKNQLLSSEDVYILKQVSRLGYLSSLFSTLLLIIVYLFRAIPFYAIFTPSLCVAVNLLLIGTTMLLIRIGEILYE